VEIVRQRAIIEGESRVRNSLLEDILTGDITSATATRRRARYLGYDLRGDQAVVVFDLDGFKEYVRAHGHDESAIQRLKDRFRRSLDSAIPGLWGRPLIWEHSDSLVMLVPAREEHPHALVERVETVRVRVQSRLAGPTVSAGIGRWYSDLSRLQQSYREAEHALRVGNAVSGPGATTAFTELGAYRLLYHLRDQPELRQFCEEALGALEQYDAEKGAELTTTLACYLDLQGNLSQTARELHLHRNGLLYRLSRIEEIAGCDLGDPAQRLTLQLALLVRPLLRPRKKPGAR
jgi:purine catabolism regulator